MRQEGMQGFADVSNGRRSYSECLLDGGGAGTDLMRTSIQPASFSNQEVSPAALQLQFQLEEQRINLQRSNMLAQLYDIKKELSKVDLNEMPDDEFEEKYIEMQKLLAQLEALSRDPASVREERNKIIQSFQNHCDDVDYRRRHGLRATSSNTRICSRISPLGSVSTTSSTFPGNSLSASRQSKRSSSIRLEDAFCAAALDASTNQQQSACKSKRARVGPVAGTPSSPVRSYVMRHEDGNGDQIQSTDSSSGLSRSNGLLSDQVESSQLKVLDSSVAASVEEEVAMGFEEENCLPPKTRDSNKRVRWPKEAKISHKDSKLDTSIPPRLTIKE